MTENVGQQLTQIGQGRLPGHMGIVFTDAGDGWIEAEMPVRPEIMTAHGYLHAASVIALADTACGFGCMRSLPEGAQSFTTIELKSNYLGTARDGVVQTRAELQHGGRMTQVWDAVVTHQETGKKMALFRCTQMILYPRG
ncbi:PaaI family thioesterase [Parvularcula sp. LCG005]|uniref:PaaI family thioesterase n=1 Tax=Parvularcula sp. LCG005 TaxID=3078805 RepID=UPI002943AB33|nr:PaaI family thioesterase [Parvularcula sp. LCG005]WOI52303.1 PaaI family thioesterase [Parvularcula sp. LCG005]